MKKKHLFLLLTAVFLLLLVSRPGVQARAFILFHGDAIHAAMSVGNGLPASSPFPDFYDGDPPMYAFPLSGFGLGSQTRYFGCYYSPADVPLPFQNAEVSLIPQGENRWIWQGDGDNHGATEKIRDHWYTYEAYF